MIMVFEKDGFSVEVYGDTRNKDGKVPSPGNTLAVHYTGMFQDGRVFGSSRDRNSPFNFEIGNAQVIKCWEEGFMHMKK